MVEIITIFSTETSEMLNLFQKKAIDDLNKFYKTGKLTPTEYDVILWTILGMTMEEVFGKLEQDTAH